MGKKNSAKGIKIALLLLVFSIIVRIVYINLPVNVPRENSIYTMHKVGESVDLGEGKFFTLLNCELTKDVKYLEDSELDLNKNVLIKMTVQTNVSDLATAYRFKLYDQYVGMCYFSDPYDIKGDTATFDLVLHIEKDMIQFLREHNRPMDLYALISPDFNIHKKETISCIKMDLDDILKNSK